MKRFVLIGFLALYALSFTEFHQVLKLPLLIEHYVEHKSLAQEITFWDFLVMHYKTDVAHDSNDNELPFKDCNHSLTTSIVALPTQKITLKEFIQPEKSFSLIYIQNAPMLLSSEIFQPPKV